MKLPSFQFYPGDWMKDPNLRRCSRAARGLWVDILCLMFECEDRGVLATGGEPWSDEDIAAASGGDISEGLSCISELLRKGVAHRNQSGAIFSKRMVRDEQVRQERIKAGSTGGSRTQAKFKQTAKQKPTPSSSPSSSGTTVPGDKPPSIIWDLGPPLLKGGGMDEPAARSLLGKLARQFGREQLAQAIATTSAANPPDPKGYLVKVLQGAGNGKARGMVI